MPRRNRNARPVVGGLAWRGRHKLQHKTVLHLPERDDDDSGSAGPVTGHGAPALTAATRRALRLAIDREKRKQLPEREGYRHE